MKIENPVAFSFILQDDLYLLNKDKAEYQHLVNNPVIMPPVVETQPLSFNYLGKHKKSFLVVVNYPGIEFMDDKHLTALENTIKRLGFDLDDTAILNIANYRDASWQQLDLFFKPEKLLVLGADSMPPGLQITHNQPQNLNNCRVLFTFSFVEMMDNTEFKKAFWEQMKQL